MNIETKAIKTAKKNTSMLEKTSGLTDCEKASYSEDTKFRRLSNITMRGDTLRDI